MRKLRIQSLFILMCSAATIMCGAAAVTCLAQSTMRPEPSDWFAGDPHLHRGIGCGRANEKEMLTPQQLLR